MQTFEDLLAAMAATVDDEPYATIDQLHEAIGERSFGPLLVAVGLAGVTPLAGVPTIPTLLALCTLLVAVQLVVGRKTFWLPGWIRRRRVKRATLRRSVRLACRPARFIDRLLRPRLHVFTGPLASRLVALICMVIAATVPVLELMPFVAALPSLAILAFGLGLSARDGALVLIAGVISTTTVVLLGQKLLG